MAAKKLIQALTSNYLSSGGIFQRIRHCPTVCYSMRFNTHNVNKSRTDSREEEEEELIWKGYRRNFKGSIPPRKTRLRCKRNAPRHTVGSPCPICKNDIEIKYTDVKLLKQFICPNTDAILPTSITGLCRLQQKKMVDAINKAREYGYITYTIPNSFLKKPVDPRFIRVPPWNRINVSE